uniref:Uncharacterized protein n=1 Tax=Magallana gigas TaxID=29159 RepID=A0A8W8IV64_MAGGI
MHVELNKEPNTIEEAVHLVVHYFEAARNTNIGNHQEEDHDRYQRTSQVKPNKDHTENGHDVGRKANNEETARQGGKKNEKPDQTEQPKEAEMICISKQDLEGMLSDMLADLKGKEHNSNNNIQLSGSGEIEVIDSGTQGHSMGHTVEEAIMRKMGDEVGQSKGVKDHMGEALILQMQVR